MSVQTGGGPKLLSPDQRFIAPAYIRERRGTGDQVLHFRRLRKQECIDRHEAKLRALKPWLFRALDAMTIKHQEPEKHAQRASWWQRVKAWFQQWREKRRRRLHEYAHATAPWLQSVPAPKHLRRQPQTLGKQMRTLKQTMRIVKEMEKEVEQCESTARD